MKLNDKKGNMKVADAENDVKKETKADGTVILTRPDGSSKETSADGKTTRMISANGTTRISWPDGTATTVPGKPPVKPVIASTPSMPTTGTQGSFANCLHTKLAATTKSLGQIASTSASTTDSQLDATAQISNQMDKLTAAESE